MRTRASLLVASLLLAGCGTFYGHTIYGPSPYVGVRTDFIAIDAGEWFFAPDVPFSAVADTIILPFDFGAWVYRMATK